jgi:hypothetical protein
MALKSRTLPASDLVPAVAAEFRPAVNRAGVNDPNVPDSKTGFCDELAANKCRRAANSKTLLNLVCNIYPFLILLKYHKTGALSFFTTDRPYKSKANYCLRLARK